MANRASPRTIVSIELPAHATRETHGCQLVGPGCLDELTLYLILQRITAHGPAKATSRHAPWNL
ncbi:hypothetical protein [Streptosporangium sp. NPDC000396]|uniref:hypothetical protein n=1 Tax=Streptosporangium sp. NPDC000396 TaxID=3366185 RepID=UPI0036C3BEA5